MPGVTRPITNAPRSGSRARRRVRESDMNRAIHPGTGREELCRGSENCASTRTRIEDPLLFAPDIFHTPHPNNDGPSADTCLIPAPKASQNIFAIIATRACRANFTSRCRASPSALTEKLKPAGSVSRRQTGAKHSYYFRPTNTVYFVDYTFRRACTTTSTWRVALSSAAADVNTCLPRGTDTFVRQINVSAAVPSHLPAESIARSVSATHLKVSRSSPPSSINAHSTNSPGHR